MPTSYSTLLESIQSDHLVAHWPLDEASGSVAYDTVNGLDGAVKGATPGAPGIGDGGTSYGYDGTGDVVNVYNAIAAASFGNAFTAFVWAKADASIWSDGVWHYLLNLGDGINNRIILAKNSDDLDARVILNGISKGNTGITDLNGSTDWFNLVLTYDYSANEVKVYLNGAQKTPTYTGLTPLTWTPHTDRCVIGAGSYTAAGFSWKGNIAHAALWDIALTPAEIALLHLTIKTLAGTATLTTTATASLSRLRGLAGTGSLQTGASASLQRVRSLSGQAALTFTAEAALEITRAHHIAPRVFVSTPEDRQFVSTPEGRRLIATPEARVFTGTE